MFQHFIAFHPFMGRACAHGLAPNPEHLSSELAPSLCLIQLESVFSQRLFNRATKSQAEFQLLTELLPLDFDFYSSLSLWNKWERAPLEHLRKPNIFSRSRCLLSTSEIKNHRNRF